MRVSIAFCLRRFNCESRLGDGMARLTIDIRRDVAYIKARMMD